MLNHFGSRVPALGYGLVRTLRRCARRVVFTANASALVLGLAATPVRAQCFSPDPHDCLDDFLCYRVKTSAGAPGFSAISGISLVDEFEATTAEVKKPGHLCTPADTQTYGVIDGEVHLQSYQTKPLLAHVKRSNIKVTNRLGELFVDTVKPDLLFVPTAKSLTAPPPPLNPADHEVDHFKCYKVKVTAGMPKFPKGVQLSVDDEFDDIPRLFDVKKPKRLCLPVDKNGEGIQFAEVHLMCYAARPAKGQRKHTQRLGVYVDNQFGSLRFDTKMETEICIPSVKTLT